MEALPTCSAQETANEAKREAAKDKNNVWQSAGQGLFFNKQTGELKTADQYLDDQMARKMEVQGVKDQARMQLEQEKARLKREEEAYKNSLAAGGMSIGQYRAAMVDLNKRKQDWAEKSKGVGSKPMTPYQTESLRLRNVGSVDSLRKEYQKKETSVQNSNQGSQTGLTLVNQPDVYTNPQVQQGLLYAWGKMLDPGSVVRESEYAAYANARGLLETWGITPEKIASGKLLTKTQIDRMRSIFAQFNNSAASKSQALREQFGYIAKERNIDPRMLFFEAPIKKAPVAPTKRPSDKDLLNKY